MKAIIAVLSLTVALGEAAPALAFDRGPHTELTESAMKSEGFGTDATNLVKVNNWFVDLYHELSVEKVPYSGHSDFTPRFLLFASRTEKWPQRLISAATRMHFDNNPGQPATSLMTSLNNTAGITAEWDRLRRATWTLMQEARAEGDVVKGLTVLGASLHPVQDFYSHTNWIEPRTGMGAEGPGWQERGFGTSPTWFDIPASEREKVAVYGDATPGHARGHGFWNADGNRSLNTGVNKDWPGRPLHIPAVITANFASRQWIQAVRWWVNDEEFWQKMQSYQANQGELDHDLEGMHDIMWHTGHWQGQGEPWHGLSEGVGGNLIAARQAVKRYFQPTHAELIGLGLGNVTGGLIGDALLRGPTKYRKRFEPIIERLADPNPAGELGPVPSSQDMQRTTKFVVLRIPRICADSLGDFGPDDADMYANVRIDGQPMSSAVINDEDCFNFPNPYEPFTWVKAVPAQANRGEPVESIEVEVKTSDSRWAGTNDDVYLRINGGLRFQLDKRLYNDFENGDRDTYSVPIDDAVKGGLEVGDINTVKIEKSEDGIGGGWKLGGVVVRVNGRVVSDTQKIERWLEDDLSLSWTAKDFVRQDPRGMKVPIWIQLMEYDLVYGGDDEGDINPYDRRRTIGFGYLPGAPLEDSTRGGNKLAGRWSDNDTASINYNLETITPETMGPIAAPASPVRTLGAQADLVITGFDFSSVTVTNLGAGEAGPFRLRAAGGTSEDTASFAGLAPGASETQRLRLPCEGFYRAIVDDLGQVAETNETNNEATSDPDVIC